MRKKGYAAGILLMALVTVALVAAGVASPEWTVAKILKENSTDCVVTRKLGLFTLEDQSAGCLVNPELSASVYNTTYVEFTAGVQYAVTAFCGISILICIVIVGISAFNICTNPYETWLSSVGLMGYNIAGLVASLLAVVLYTVLLYTELEQPIIDEKPADTLYNVYRSENFYLEEDAYFGYSFFLVVVSILTYVLGAVLALLSERDTVDKIKNVFSPKEEETDDQKMKDIMIY